LLPSTIILVPILFVCNEVTSFYGVGYSLISVSSLSSKVVIIPRYTSTLAKTLDAILISASLSILIVVHLLVLVVSLRFISHIKHISELGGTIPGVTLKSSAYFAIGVALIALDAAFGLVPQPTFATVLLRRVLEALSRLFIISSLIV
jgi:hypothetical protein